MELDIYIEKTRELAIYPDDYERDYVIHGLVDELGELRETLDNPPMESGLTTEKMSTEHVQKIEEEMGDVTWYLARAIDHFGFDFADYWNNYSASEGTISPEKGEELIQEALLSAARINGHQKKSVRDDDNRKEQIQRELSEIVRNLRKASHHFGLRDLDVVTRRNLEKLFDRKERNVLHGDGNSR